MCFGMSPFEVQSASLFQYARALRKVCRDVGTESRARGPYPKAHFPFSRRRFPFFAPHKPPFPITQASWSFKHRRCLQLNINRHRMLATPPPKHNKKHNPKNKQKKENRTPLTIPKKRKRKKRNVVFTALWE